MVMLFSLDKFKSRWSLRVVKQILIACSSTMEKLSLLRMVNLITLNFISLSAKEIFPGSRVRKFSSSFPEMLSVDKRKFFENSYVYRLILAGHNTVSRTRLPIWKKVGTACFFYVFIFQNKWKNLLRRLLDNLWAIQLDSPCSINQAYLEESPGLFQGSIWYKIEHNHIPPLSSMR